MKCGPALVGFGLTAGAVGLCWWFAVEFRAALDRYGPIVDLGLVHHPDRAFRRHEPALRDWVRRLRAGEVRSEPGRGYAMPQFLVDEGAKCAALLDDGCLVVVFNFMPCDAVPELWHCPAGFDPPPSRLDELRRTKAFFRWEQLAPDWGVCRWDQ